MGKGIGQKSNKYMIPDLKVWDSALIPYIVDNPSQDEIEKMRQSVYRRPGKYRTAVTDMGLWIRRIK